MTGRIEAIGMSKTPLSLTLLISLMAITGCGAYSAPSKTPSNPPGTTTADFTLAATPGTATLTGGGAGQSISVTATAVSGFSAPIAVSVSGLPAGVTASPTTLTLTPGTAQSITLSAAATAAANSATVTLAGVSGTLTHAATLALTVQAATVTPVPLPDFTLAVSPASEAIVQGTAGTPLSVTATATNGFTSPVTVAITGLPTGVIAAPASLTLTPGTAQSVTLTAGASAVPAATTVTFTGTSAALSHSATLDLTIQAAPTPPPASSPDVTTYHFDNARDGLNAQETTLTTANVKSVSFGKIGSFPGDGLVDAQPLYLNGLSINGTAANVLYMATEHDSVYAFNADTGAMLWQVSMLQSGESTAKNGCSQITPEIGVTSTPVIDRAKGAIYVVAMSVDAGGAYHQRLHALNLTTGAELAGSPSEITGSYPGTGDSSSGGNVLFVPAQYAERVGLLLLNGQIYLAFTSHCDQPPYTGWVMSYDETTLQQSSVIDLTPNGSDGAIWMSGEGLAADTSGNIYLLDANGTLDGALDANGFPSRQDYGNAIVKLSTSGGKLAVADYFTPWNTADESARDIDLGSGGAMLLPDLTDASGKVRHLLVGAGKDGHIYVGDRDNLGKFNQKTQDNSNLYQDLPAALASGAWSSPAYFNNTVYYGGQGDVLRAFPVASALLATTPSSSSTQVFAYPGSTPSVSANGTQNGILWALESNVSNPAVLHAYDATNLGTELYNSNQAASGRDAFGNGNKFITPVIVNGKVFIGTPTGVAVFGLLP